ncbi:bifunctional folylpolyglutamate synthase/dihydrofolate synthase [Allofustis seminis]|uniref:bifunctional folylpolyglutamate synthase/dihydrofolate synthase n=1 Tax=Allofustis seminis TaxID=166939 RepID=UPI00036B4F3B|nr:folylpolyglutamate synthase/dihydrofolate synthase family protein [Allofustis seminis]
MSKKKWLEMVQKSRGTHGRKDLSMMKKLMDALDHPERKARYIHVAGTNGKGSTSAFLTSILTEAGYSVGLFTSPHLESICERIRLNGELIDEAEFEHLMEKVGMVALKIEAEVNRRYSAFELITAAAFLYFAKKAPDVVLLEVGVGGRLDGTNVIPAENVYATVVTSIGLDHMGVLGDTEEAIAFEKAGIFKAGVPAFIGDFKPSIYAVFAERAAALNIPLYKVDSSKKVLAPKITPYFTQKFTYAQVPYEIQLLGIHQTENAALAIIVADYLAHHGFHLELSTIQKGLRQAFWAGRMEKILDHPLFFIDGAHNEIAVRRLVETLKEQFEIDHFSFVIGMMKDKAYEKMIDLVWEMADRFIVVSPDEVRGFDAKAVAQQLAHRGKEAIYAQDAQEVRQMIEQDINKDAIWIQFGSLYLVGALKKAFKK